MQNEAYRLADALAAAIKARDPDQLRAIYADTIRVWHGATGKAMGGVENIGLLTALFQITSRLEYIGVRRYEIEGGLVEQHQLVGAFDDGKPIPALNACMVIKVADGKITSIDEYFDSETFSEVWARLAALSEA